MSSRFDSVISGKIKTFYNLLAEGKEFYYEPQTDTLYSDVNYTITDEHLGLKMLEYFGGDILNKSKNIWNKDRPKSSKVRSIARLLQGKTLLDLREASEFAVDNVNIPQYVNPILSQLKPSRLVLWSDTPIQTINAFVRKKVDPIYNADSINLIDVYATELDHVNGVLTGRVGFIPDEFFRHNMQHLERLKHLSNNIEEE